jgi:hypothetical protein
MRKCLPHRSPKLPGNVFRAVIYRRRFRLLKSRTTIDQTVEEIKMKKILYQILFAVFLLAFFNAPFLEAANFLPVRASAMTISN